MKITEKQATAFRDSLLRGGFHLGAHATISGITSTRLDLPGVVTVVFTTEDGQTFDTFFRWRQ
jgi:hypothetical protein